MSKSRAIEEIQRSIESLLAEAEAARALGDSPPAAAAAPPPANPPPQSDTSSFATVDLSGDDSDLPPVDSVKPDKPHPTVVTPQAPIASASANPPNPSQLDAQARAMIAEWIQIHLPNIAERVVRDSLIKK